MNNETSMRELPSPERPYERCRQAGPQALSDAELLAVLLRTGTKGQNVLETARKILALDPAAPGLLGLYHLTWNEYKRVPGIGEVKAVQLACISELAKRMSRGSVRREEVFLSPESVALYYMEEMRHREKEELRTAYLDTKGRLLADLCLSVGTVNSSLVSPREIFLEAFRFRAVRLILVHNHPSGDPEPSREDILVTKRTVQAGKLLGIEVDDHIIIGDNCYISLKERGMV